MALKKDRTPRVLFAGFEIGGQMQLLANTIRNRWVQATAVSYNEDFRGYQNDINLNGNGRRGFLGRLFFAIWAMVHYDVFHFFWGVSLFSWWRFHLIDLPLLKLFKKKIIVHFRGLDVIDIKHFDYLRERSRGEITAPPPISRPEQLRKLKKWIRYADHVLISEPDLYVVAPSSAILSPQVIDMKYWSINERPLSEKDGIIRIVHAPSSRRKKGTDFIEQSIAELKSKGYAVELILAEKLPHHKIKELYEMSDIGIDQVIYGWHGKVSVELMALEKPVVCYIAEEWKKYRPDLPIVSAVPSTLTETLEKLIVNKELRENIGKESLEYVKRHHDVECISTELLQLYGFPKTSLVKDEIENAAMW